MEGAERRLFLVLPHPLMGTPEARGPVGPWSRWLADRGDWLAHGRPLADCLGLGGVTVPWAALARRGLNLTGGADWLLAEPLSLTPAGPRLACRRGAQLALTGEEVEQFVRDLNQRFGEEERLFEPTSEGFFFLQVSRPPAIETRPPFMPWQGDAPWLPGGPAGGTWRAWLAEVEMFLHDHPINRQRAGRGAPAFNGLWLWGEGALPEALHRRWTRVAGADVWSRGLAALAGCPLRSPARFLEELQRGDLPAGDSLLVWPAAYTVHDAGAAGDPWETLRESLLDPLEPALRRLDGLVLCSTGEKGYYLIVHRRRSRLRRALREWIRRKSHN